MEQEIRRYNISSALPYINGVKHLGNLIGSQLPADVHARFRRSQGHEVLFHCATDEHGTPAELAAQAAGMEVSAYCDAQHAVQKALADGFLLSFDKFGRSSSAENRKLTQHFADRLEDAGLIEERTTVGLYCLDDARFLPDRYVEGTCPKCGFDGARGDQCDSCGSLMDPTELIAPRSRISGSTRIEHRPTKHLFLLQSRMVGQIREWVDGSTGWSKLAKSIAYKWLDEGIQDRSITRDLEWGVPVTRNSKPRPGFETKRFYVWFDAPICYIAETMEWSKDTGSPWQRWWRTDMGAHDVTYIEFMGKDNVAFHTVSFPITLIGSGEPWKTVDRIKSFDWLTWYGGKFSTSASRGIFMDAALDLLPADAWRWALVANCPENSDTAFTVDLLQTAVNSDLANVIGNYVVRLTKFCAAAFGGAVPDGGLPGPLEEALYADVDRRLAALTAAHEAMEFRKAASETRALWAVANAYMSASAPWSAIKEDRAASAVCVRTALGLMAVMAEASSPIIPEAAGRILSLLQSPPARRRWPSGRCRAMLAELRPGTRVTPMDTLFAKLTDERAAAMQERFGGSVAA